MDTTLYEVNYVDIYHQGTSPFLRHIPCDLRLKEVKTAEGAGLVVTPIKSPFLTRLPGDTEFKKLENIPGFFDRNEKNFPTGSYYESRGLEGSVKAFYVIINKDVSIKLHTLALEI